MTRALAVSFLLLGLVGCQLPPERAALRPLPEDGPPQPLPYAELLTRARFQATAATEAFYVNRWADLEDTARGLQQTARYLVKAEDVPPTLKGKLADLAADLGKEAQQLRTAAKNKDVDETNKVLQRLHRKVRELRLDPAPAEGSK